MDDGVEITGAGRLDSIFRRFGISPKKGRQILAIDWVPRYGC
jgi:hypothetical protein